MLLKQSLASALYLINPKFISSFSACYPTFEGGCAGEGGGQNKEKSQITPSCATTHCPLKQNNTMINTFLEIHFSRLPSFSLK